MLPMHGATRNTRWSGLDYRFIDAHSRTAAGQGHAPADHNDHPDEAGFDVLEREREKPNSGRQPTRRKAFTRHDMNLLERRSQLLRGDATTGYHNASQRLPPYVDMALTFFPRRLGTIGRQVGCTTYKCRFIGAVLLMASLFCMAQETAITRSSAGRNQTDSSLCLAGWSVPTRDPGSQP